MAKSHFRKVALRSRESIQCSIPGCFPLFSGNRQTVNHLLPVSASCLTHTSTYASSCKDARFENAPRLVTLRSSILVPLNGACARTAHTVVLPPVGPNPFSPSEHPSLSVPPPSLLLSLNYTSSIPLLSPSLPSLSASPSLCAGSNLP